jgi:hypothetical protein
VGSARLRRGLARDDRAGAGIRTVKARFDEPVEVR